ncbi:MAG: hypothetical protein JOZ80_12970 [Acidobacteriaceae bacterium]|nr:hypothetical protein [Acidobacteriaceae bacterium]
MRIYEDNYAYEIERVLDPLTEIMKGWRYNVACVRAMNCFVPEKLDPRKLQN